ncbi:MAG: NUDIX hydrolase [Pontibacter sp.]|nr:NUDIX hydrolase [Pontibacter sp.]
MLLHSNKESAKPKLQTVEQVSSGGVAYRIGEAGPEVALISVGPQERWQLPKGIVDAGETPDVTAVREVREEAGINTRLLRKIDTIEYWFVGSQGRQRVRFHKFVHFFLLQYTSGNTADHDYEVNEARWVPLEKAQHMLSFKSEKNVVEQAKALIKGIQA